MRRPPRISTRPALAAEGAQRHARSPRSGPRPRPPRARLGDRGARSRCARAGRRPPRDLVEPREHLVGRELAVAADARTRRPAPAVPACARRPAAASMHGVAERAGQARLVAVGERVAAHVDEDDEVAAQLARAASQAGRDRRRPAGGVHEHGLLAEQLRHARLGEAHAARRARGWPRRRPSTAGRRATARALDLLRGARAGLAGRSGAAPRLTPPEHRAGAVLEPAVLGRGERAHHVAAAADAEHERPPGAASSACASITAAQQPGHLRLALHHRADVERAARASRPAPARRGGPAAPRGARRAPATAARAISSEPVGAYGAVSTAPPAACSSSSVPVSSGSPRKLHAVACTLWVCTSAPASGRAA